MTEKKKFLRLDSLIAYVPTESDGDEIFIKYKGEKIAPVEGKYLRVNREPHPLDIEIEIEDSENWVELELWDYDLFSRNDSIGKFRLLVDETGDNFSTELTRHEGSEAQYVLGWSVIERARR